MPGFIIVVVCIVGAILWGLRAGKKQRDAMGVLVERLGLRFSRERDYPMAKRYVFLDQPQQGSNRYVHHMISGTYQGHEIAVFDYHYETHSTASAEKGQIHHHDRSFFLLTLKKGFPERPGVKEGFFSTIAQAAGHDSLSIEVDQDLLILHFDERLSVENIEPRLNQLIEIRSIIASHFGRKPEPNHE